MFKKIIAASFVFSFAGLIFLTAPKDVLAQLNAGYSGQNPGKTPLQLLVPVAEMRAPLVEAKDLDGCIVGLFSGIGGCSWDSIAFFLAKLMINVQFDGMKNMAQTGFFGNTSFIDNPQSYYRTINGEVTDYFLANDFYDANLLDVIKNDTRRTILSNQVTPFTQSISEGIDFPGGEAGYQQFLADGTCQTGNFYDCQLALESPKNDKFSVFSRTQAQLDKQQSEALSHTQAEVQAGTGYRDVKENCVYGHYIGCETITPGSNVETGMDNYLKSSMDQLQASDELDEAVAPAVVLSYKTIIGWLSSMNLATL